MRTTRLARGGGIGGLLETIDRDGVSGRMPLTVLCAALQHSSIRIAEGTGEDLAEPQDEKLPMTP
jgi:hypothetical protein